MTINTRPITRGLRSLMVGAALMLIGGAIAHACPNCGLDVIEGQKGGASLAEGFTYSMVGMASAPFLVFSSVAAFIIRKYRRRS